MIGGWGDVGLIGQRELRVILGQETLTYAATKGRATSLYKKVSGGATRWVCWTGWARLVRGGTRRWDRGRRRIGDCGVGVIS